MLLWWTYFADAESETAASAGSECVTIAHECEGISQGSGEGRGQKGMMKTT